MLRHLQKHPAIRVGLGTATEDLFRCISDVVMEVGKKYFEELIDKMKAEKGVKQDVELTAEDLKELAKPVQG